MDIQNGPGNAVNNSHIDIIRGFYIKVERTILYIQMLLTYWLKIWRKKIQHGVGPRLIVNVQWQGHCLYERKQRWWRSLKLKFALEKVSVNTALIIFIWIKEKKDWKNLVPAVYTSKQLNHCLENRKGGYYLRYTTTGKRSYRVITDSSQDD